MSSAAEGSGTVGARLAEAGYEGVIGLEIHVQLATRTKLFCACPLGFGAAPNTQVCPVCLGHPGTLPVVNEQAIHLGLVLAAALDCEVAERSVFARKNYFYPDLPKGYQISQYEHPLARGGELEGVRLDRVHLEDDAAKSSHVGESGRIHGSGATLVDFNRGGTPLAEIVTEVDLRSAAHAREWLRLLRATVRQAGVSDANMEEGSLRCDANVSIRPAGSEELGTKTELKNMNSFRFVERGIEAELARQLEMVEAGETVTQETLHFDPRSGSLTPLRSKEEAHDYRYFPEPDLEPVAPTPEMIERARAALPELPAKRHARYREELGIAEDQARMLAFEPELGDYLDAAMEAGDGLAPRPVANWVTGELIARLRERGEDADPAASRVTPAAIAALVSMVERREIAGQAGRDVLGILLEEGGDPRAIVEREGLASVSGGDELEQWVDAAIDAEPEAAEKVRAGEERAIGPLVGAVMKQAKGRADGGQVREMLLQRLRS